jgi:HAD superfamily hydrolase (TIGR01509 family)
MTLRAVFFDFDGLLCDTERAAFRSWEELYAKVGCPFPGMVWQAMVGRSTGADVAIADLAERLGAPPTPELLNWRLTRKSELAAVEPLRSGVLSLLAEAEERGLTTAVVSSSSRDWVGGHLDRLGVSSRFAAVITGDEVARHKPAPDLYLAALSRTGVAPGEVVAFEDSALGVTAARAAGLRCVGVPASVGCPDIQADLVLGELTEFDFDAVMEWAA